MNELPQSNSARPLVSVLMPLYNEARFVEQTLETLLAQSYEHVEFIVADNCSTDDTWAILCRCAERDSRIKHFRHPENIGSTANWAYAFKMSRGEYVMCAAGHDKYHKDYIAKCLDMLLNDRELVMAYSAAEFIDTDDRVVEPIWPYLDTRGLDLVRRVNTVLWTLGYAYQMYGLFRRDVFEYWPQKAMFGPDFLFLVCASIKGAFAQVPAVLFQMRQNFDFHDARAYAQKLLLDKDRKPQHPDDVCLELLREIVLAIRRLVPKEKERTILMASAVLAFAGRPGLFELARKATVAEAMRKRTDIEFIAEKFANEALEWLQDPESPGQALRRAAQNEILKQFTPEELLAMLSWREIVASIGSRSKKSVLRRLRR